MTVPDTITSNGAGGAADVVVIGSGAAGLAAAIAAHDCGASVIVVEASEKFGGATAVSGGMSLRILCRIAHGCRYRYSPKPPHSAGSRDRGVIPLAPSRFGHDMYRPVKQ